MKQLISKLRALLRLTATPEPAQAVARQQPAQEAVFFAGYAAGDRRHGRRCNRLLMRRRPRPVSLSGFTVY